MTTQEEMLKEHAERALGCRNTAFKIFIIILIIIIGVLALKFVLS